MCGKHREASTPKHAWETSGGIERKVLPKYRMARERVSGRDRANQAKLQEMAGEKPDDTVTTEYLQKSLVIYLF